jgi:hypothetical protein
MKVVSQKGHDTNRTRPKTLTVILMTPNRSFTYCRYPIKHKKYPDSNKAFSVEDGRKCIYMEDCHKNESTQDTERTSDYNRHSVLGKAVTKGSIC